MIKKEDLKDWLAEGDREEYAEKLEAYIDGEIKKHALKGETTFYIQTGYWGKDGSKRARFYDLWYTGELSEANREIVKEEVLDRYKAFGFDVEITSVDCGWNNHFVALLFSDIDEVLEK